MDDTFDTHGVLRTLVEGGTLDEPTADACFESLLTGGLDEAQIGAIIALIQRRGATTAELIGAARAMRRHVTPVRVSPKQGEILLDTCGTGGATKTFNISTATAFVVAAAKPDPDSGIKRVLVAKHGNRSRTGRGSAEILAALGVNIEASPDIQLRCLEEVGVCFSFAMRHHPAMRHAAGPRRSLGFPTIFNLLGPLTNPAGADHQLLGVYRDDLVETVAEALAGLGTKRAAVVHGGGGLDECSTLGPNTVCWVVNGSVRTDRVDPADLGIQTPRLESLQASDLDHGVRLIRGVLSGEAGPAGDIVRLNAALALTVSGVSGSIKDGMTRAHETISTGAAGGMLERLIECSTE